MRWRSGPSVIKAKVGSLLRGTDQSLIERRPTGILEGGDAQRPSFVLDLIPGVIANLVRRIVYRMSHPAIRLSNLEFVPNHAVETTTSRVPRQLGDLPVVGRVRAVDGARDANVARVVVHAPARSRRCVLIAR